MLSYAFATAYALAYACYQSIRVTVIYRVLGLLGKSFPPSPATTGADRHDRAILVTGTSTGIGHDIMQQFLFKGYTVFATVRNEAAATRIRNETLLYEGNLILLIMDVRDLRTLDQASLEVSRWLGENASRQLVAVINNAGTTEAMPLELESFEAVTTIIDTNLVGVMRVSKVFLPYLRESKGRLVVIGSMLGSIGMPMFSSYCATKAGLEAWCDSMRRELAPQGISVSLIRPGTIDTEFFRKGEEWFNISIENLNDVQTIIKRRYYQKFFDFFSLYLPTAKGRGLSPYYVSVAVVDSVESLIPQTRYIVGVDSWLVIWASRLLPTLVLDIGMATAIGALAFLSHVVSPGTRK